MGTGYFELDHTLYGIPLPGKRQRAEMLAEACQILKGLWNQERFSFFGEYYTITDAPSEPKPVQQGGPPLLIGGGGERAIRTAARYADQWNLPDGSRGILPDDFRRKYAALQRNCEEFGRDPAEIETSVALVVIVEENPAAARRRYEAVAELRRYDEERAARHVIAGTPEQVVETLKAWEGAGVNHFLLHLIPDFTYGDVELFSEAVLPQLRP
jgi:alkanesulfonate monooxygenase SsuD/methylene tetrahydromethanopterin reductase-like flavin-dependent oxidoreductase (luciferase family)